MVKNSLYSRAIKRLQCVKWIFRYNTIPTKASPGVFMGPDKLVSTGVWEDKRTAGAGSSCPQMWTTYFPAPHPQSLTGYPKISGTLISTHVSGHTLTFCKGHMWQLPTNVLPIPQSSALSPWQVFPLGQQRRRLASTVFCSATSRRVLQNSGTKGSLFCPAKAAPPWRQVAPSLPLDWAS